MPSILSPTNAIQRNPTQFTQSQFPGDSRSAQNGSPRLPILSNQRRQMARLLSRVAHLEASPHPLYPLKTKVLSIKQALPNQPHRTPPL